MPAMTQRILSAPAAGARSQGGDLVRVLTGVAAVVFPLVYLLSDVVETVQGDFSTFRLVLTYLGESAIPLFVLGLFAAQRPRIGPLGLTGAVLYAYSYIFFTATVVYALTGATRNWDGVTSTFGGWLTLHGALMCVGGVLFGLSSAAAGVLPRWTGWCLAVGVVLVAAASGLPNLARTVAAAVPDAAFAGMGVSLLLHKDPAITAPAGPAFRMTRLRRAGDAAITPLIRAGLVPHTYLLTTVGRRTGLPRTHPVVLVEKNGRRWLVAPYGAVSWVHNARAAGRVTLRRRGRTWTCKTREITPAQEAAPILREYLSLTGPPRRYFRARVGDPVERFAAEAAEHPVFELT